MVRHDRSISQSVLSDVESDIQHTDQDDDPPGAIRPAIDNIEQKLMTGQEIALQIYKLLIVPADGGGDRGGPDPKGLVLDNTDNGIDNGMLELASSPGRILVLAAACGFPPL